MLSESSSGNEGISSLDRLRDLFVASFRFSQGEPGQQYMIFKYVHELFPELRLTDELKYQIYLASKDRIHSIVFASLKNKPDPLPRQPGMVDYTHHSVFDKSLSNSRITPEGVDETMHDMLLVFQVALDEKLLEDPDTQKTLKRLLGGIPNLSHKNLIIEIAKNMLKSDYFHMKMGRSYSFYDQYVLKSKRSGIPSLDNLFLDIKFVDTDPHYTGDRLIKYYSREVSSLLAKINI
jgi:hypothetical protein